jgi:hypothetical protein
MIQFGFLDGSERKKPETESTVQGLKANAFLNWDFKSTALILKEKK